MSWVSNSLVGAVAAVVTYVLVSGIRQQRRLLASGIRTVGTVTGCEEEDTQEAGVRSRLLVQFTASNGRSYTGRSSWRAGRPQQWAGDVVAIVYEASNPYGFVLAAELHETRSYLLLGLTWAGAAYCWWSS